MPTALGPEHLWKDEISKLDEKQLRLLKTLVCDEVQDRASFHKCDTLVGWNLYYPFYIQFKKDGADRSPIARCIGSMERAVHKLCDYTLHNYTVGKANGADEKIPRVNGQLIMVDSKKYQSMCNDILAVVNKYAKKENPEIDRMVWAAKKVYEERGDVSYDDAADYILEHFSELGEEYSRDAYKNYLNVKKEEMNNE
jgi:hypothetical protein